MLKNYFSLKVRKIISLLIIFIYGLLHMRGPVCTGGTTCNVSYLMKLYTYAGSILLPGTTQLMRDNGFFIGYKTYGVWDAIPQLILHIGIDIFYWYLIVCVLVYLVNKVQAAR